MKKGQGWAKKVTLDNLASFADFLRQDEPAERVVDESAETERAPRAPSPFQGIGLTYPNRFSAARINRGAKSKEASAGSGVAAARGAEIKASLSAPAAAATPAATAGMKSSRGPVVWQKHLSPTDAQKKRRPNSKPTGCLRLTQATKVNQKKIDQTKFFRDEVFAGFPWGPIKAKQYEEATVVPFDIKINGKRVGVFDLQIRQKPSGEAGQGNYTASLHWGKKLTDIIRKSVKPGQLFSLYRPAAGSEPPFFIEIS